MLSAPSFADPPTSPAPPQAAELLQLFTFIRADLAAYKPQSRAASELSYGEASIGSEGFGEPSASGPASEPRFPKSLCLLKPLFATHELNAVASAAQASVPVPDGLDLDAWIVPPPAEPTTPEADDMLDGKKGKKGKKKDKDAGKTKRKGKGRARVEDGLADGDEDEFGALVGAKQVETEEERAERERVSVSPS